MEIVELAAVLFSLITIGVIAFQLALAFGAPWGAYAMGGAFPGKYPIPMRIAAIVQSFIMAVVALTVLSVAGVATAPWGPTPTWVVWGIAALLVLGLILNLITPSAGERRIWAPVVAAMLACCITVAILA